ncbi:BGL7 [[Candida] subhashii]|uniref:beta-glucosidase n=1 Tax=[Candida] subhashii TaxID=561895 RepID=A0A8J5Q0B5_9ASCO|nr:BGL7 [[Candida] subhashii]KAG7660389.1 BGL7 [[Candida] subhashii]
MTEFDIDTILQKLTLEEKISLLAGIDFWHTKPLHQHGIKSLRFSDGPNGLRGTRFFNSIPAACFPCGTGLAATFDKTLLEKTGELMGEEAYHKGVHVILGPTMNIQRGPLGGRGFESFSEDPYLTGKVAGSIIKGIENKGIAATPKHFVCNDLEHERNASDSRVSERALREIYLEPFRIALEEGNPHALMTGYNKVNGEHCSQNKRLLEDIVRKEWGWNGTVMSDWWGTYTTKNAIENGLDIEMPGPTLFRRVDTVSHMVKTKELNIQDLDARVRNVLKLVEYAKKNGIPEKGEENTTNNTPETSAFLRKLAQDTIVLLKNENNLLPLSKSDSIAVIGPNAKIAAYCGGGSASLRAYYTTTPYDSIAAKLDSAPKYTVGAYAHNLLPGMAPQLINPKTKSKGYNLKFYLEPPGTANRTLIDEYDLDLSYLHFPDFYNPKVKDDLFYIDFEGEFTPDADGDYEFGVAVVGTAQLFIDGKLIVDNKTKQRFGNTFFNSGTVEEKGIVELEKNKTYKIRVEFGSGPTFTIKSESAEYFGGGVNLGLAKCIDEDEEIAKAVELAKGVDKVVLSIGLNSEWEAESFDRPHMKLEGLQDKLVEAVLEANPNTIIVNQSGTPVEFPWLDKAPALVHAWYGGNEGGNAIADVLFGDANPSGKLTLSFPKKNVDNPAYLNFKTERGRVLYGEDIFVGYRFYEKMERDVAFPFGFGLSYSKFDISNLTMLINEPENKLVVSVDVKNVGKVAGSEVVQAYISKSDSDVIRPVKELKGFEKVHLRAGEKKKVEIELSIKNSVSFWDEYMDKWSVQAGEYNVHVGNSSDNTPLVGKFDLKKSFFWRGN